MPHPRSRARRRLLAALIAAAVLGAVAPAAAAPERVRLPRTSTAPAAPLALAAPSPDLLGLPAVSLELASIPVDSVAFRRAQRAYEASDKRLGAGQADRVDAQRALSELAAQRAQLTAEVASARARTAGLRSRLDAITTAVSQLGVDIFVSGGTSARLDAALATDHPSISDADRREVLGTSSLDVLLAEKAAYQDRLDEVTAHLERAEAGLRAVTERQQATLAQRSDAAHREAEASPMVASARVGYEDARVLAQVDGVEFQLVALDAYYRAARQLRREDPSCRLHWWGLAGISRVEGHHGTYGGAQLLESGDQSRPIVGIPLDGSNQTAVITDTDGGALDGDTTFDRAVGPMQFIPGTWRRFASDGNGDGVATPFNLYDATLAAGRYLCRASGGLDGDGGLRTAYFSYNQSLAYVDAVLSYARSYETAVDVPEPVD
jgi:membrane-bound lytic murein transglycosylase B